MGSSRLTNRRLPVLAVVLAVLLAGCGQSQAESDAVGGGTGGGGRAPGAVIDADLMRGARFTVGSKEFPEQLLLGQITAQALQAAGALVTDSTGIEGSEATRRALTSGDIDMYWEYTGTAQLTYLHGQPISDPRQLYQAVASADKANGVEWLDPAPANNAFGFAVRREAVRDLGVRTITDLANLVGRRPADATLCAAEEFLQRSDGLPGVEQVYGFAYPPGSVVRLDLDAIYGEVDRGRQCNFGEVFLTDGRIVADELFVLEDDKEAFTTYNPSLTVRSEVLQQNPKLRDVFDAIAAKLTNDTLRQLNAQITVAGRAPQDVARDFLDDNGFIG